MTDIAIVIRFGTPKPAQASAQELVTGVPFVNRSFFSLPILCDSVHQSNPIHHAKFFKVKSCAPGRQRAIWDICLQGGCQMERAPLQAVFRHLN